MRRPITGSDGGNVVRARCAGKTFFAARQRENFFKSGAGRAFLRSLS
jgi:hypothetical protein